MLDPVRVMDIPRESRQLLVELAYVACMTNRVDAARRLLAGLSVIAPGTREVVVGDALADLTAGDANAAIARLRPLADSGDAYCVAFLALALKLAGYGAQSAACLAAVPPGSPDVDALADALRS